MKEVLDINIYKVHANYKSLFTERQCYIFMSLAQGTYAIAASSGGNPPNTMSTL